MNSLLEIDQLCVDFPIAGQPFHKKRILKAVEKANLSLQEARTLALVGESGSGKSTIARSILRLNKITSGKIFFDGLEITSLKEKELTAVRPKMQAVFQDPYSSLNPRLTIREILSESLLYHKKLEKKFADELVQEALENVNLPKDILSRFPFEFSGGQRQRISIARAILLDPKLIVCDEALSALDITTSILIAKLLKELQSKKNISYLFISHDIHMVAFMADTIAVMYLGKIVEIGQKKNILENPRHPYTKSLLDSKFSILTRKVKKIPLEGEIPSMLQKPKGCIFHSRCPRRKPICETEHPTWSGNSQSGFACHFPI